MAYNLLQATLHRMNTLASLTEVSIQQSELNTMLDFSRLMYRLKKMDAYQQYIESCMPASAMLGADHNGMLMGFDFHLTDDGPKLIEINNNAGGLFVGDAGWLAQPTLCETGKTLAQQLQSMFPSSWRTMAIIDEAIEQQFMYPEMQAYADLLRAEGRQVFLLSPENIELRDGGLYYHDQRLDGIYNRHTDFYLETDAMQHIHTALKQNLVDLNPFPRSYALLGDKTRMADWWQPGLLESLLTAEQCQMIRHIVPEVRRMQSMSSEEIWKQRKQWVFKPPSSHAGKGVVLGKGITRKRFASLDALRCIMQAYVPASEIEHKGESFRFDIRLYMHGPQLIALAGRLWRGQLTNFRESGSGWTAIRIA